MRKARFGSFGALRKGARRALGSGRVASVPALGRRVKHEVSWPVGSDHRPARKQLASVFKYNDTVAEQAPALIRVTHYRAGRLTVRC